MRDSIPQEDWETATRACKRAMDIPSAVTGGAFAARVIVCPLPFSPSPQQFAYLAQLSHSQRQWTLPRLRRNCQR